MLLLLLISQRSCRTVLWCLDQQPKFRVVIYMIYLFTMSEPVERKAIRNNVNSIEAMEKAIMVTWNHIRSTDENLHHHLCPTGEHSW